MEVKTLEGLEVFDAATHAMVDRQNALALFPRLAGVLPHHDGLGAKVKRAVAAPIVDIVDKIRDR